MVTTVTQLSPQQHRTLVAANPQQQQAFEQLPLNKADTILVLTDDIHAHGWCSVWWRQTPSYQQFKTACIGHYYAPTSDIAQLLLQHAQNILKQHHFEYVVAPMDSSTWHSYRLTTQMYNEHPFFLDRITPLEWNQHFTDSGFQNIANYASTIVENLDYFEAAAPIWQQRFTSDPTCSLRSLNMSQIQSQLQELYTLSLNGFKNNFLYTDITQAEFETLYRSILPIVIPDLVQMAYINNQLVGFAFAVPDYAQKTRAEPIDTLILKTVVRHPSPEYKGLGAFLIWNAHQLAKAHGYQRLITAFMHEENVSLHLSLKAGKIIRKYALYGKQL